MHELSRKTNRSNIVILDEEINDRVGWLYLTDVVQKTGNAVRWLPSVSRQRTTDVLVADTSSAAYLTRVRNEPRSLLAYKWRECIQVCQTYRSTSVECGHAPVCIRQSMRFSGHANRMTRRRIDCDHRPNLINHSTFRNALAEKPHYTN